MTTQWRGWSHQDVPAGATWLLHSTEMINFLKLAYHYVFLFFFNFTSVYHIRVYNGCVTWMGHEQTSQEGPTSKVTSTVLWELTRVEYCNKKDRINKTILYFTDVPEDYCSLER